MSGLRNVEPFRLRRLVVGCEDFHGLSTFQLLTYGVVLAVYASTHAAVTHSRVNGVSKVEYRGTGGQAVKVAFGREHIDIIGLHSGRKILRQHRVVARFERRPDVGQPSIHAPAATLDAFVTPVGGQAVFGNLVHAFRPDLHFHPFILRPFHRDVQTFVAVAFGHGQPVAQTFQVAFVFVGNQREHLPALFFFFLQRCIENDADGKEIVHAAEAALLFLHLLPDGVDALGAPLHVVAQSLGVEHLADRFGEAFDVGIAGAFGGVQALFDEVVGIVFQIFQAQVLQLAFQFVESQLVGQRCKEVSRLG